MKYRFGEKHSILDVRFSIIRDADGAVIPTSQGNRDYQQFLLDWEAGAEVLNPDGTPAPYVAPETP